MATGKREFYFEVEGKSNQVDAIKEVSQIVSKYMAGVGCRSVKFQQSTNDGTGTCYIKIV